MLVGLLFCLGMGALCLYRARQSLRYIHPPQATALDCKVHVSEGCPYVLGTFCNYPNCALLDEYNYVTSVGELAVHVHRLQRHSRKL